MKQVILFIPILAILMTSCRSYTIPQAGKNHPAHPQALSSPELQQHELLKVDENNLPKIPAEMNKQEV